MELQQLIELAEQELHGEAVLTAGPHATLRVAQAQVFATLAVAQAIARLADAVEAHD